MENKEDGSTVRAPFNRMMSKVTAMTKALGKPTDIHMSNIMSKRTEDDYKKRKTKIVCTMGPSCWDVDMLVHMIDAGMNVARLNFSHGDHEGHGKVVRNIVEARKLRPQANVAIMLDTKGPEIRTGMLKNHEAVELVKGQSLIITTDYSFEGDSTKIACSYEKLPSSVAPGNVILMADGTISCEVVKVGEDFVEVTVSSSATLGERKNMNLPNVKVDLPVISAKDEKDLVEFGIPMGCHFVAASFVQCADDVRRIREVLGPRGRHIRVIPKIENVEGLNHFDEILAEADGIMVARGDLGMEIPPEKVFLAQKMMIAKCSVVGKPVITATQMLESMTKNCRPTRAECGDVANAVLDGTDCVMLSGETAGGLFPLEAVSVMSKVCVEAESCIEYKSLYRAIVDAVPLPIPIPEAVARAAVETAASTSSKLLLALTETGHTARLIVKYRPKCLILALSASESTIRHLQMHRGIVTMQVPSFQGTDHVIRNALIDAKERNLVQPGDSIVAVHGIKEEVAGHSNLVKVLQVT